MCYVSPGENMGVAMMSDDYVRIWFRELQYVLYPNFESLKENNITWPCAIGTRFWMLLLRNVNFCS